MQLNDLYPTRGTFEPGEPVILLAEVHAEAARAITLHVTIRNVTSTATAYDVEVNLMPGCQTVELAWQPPPIGPRGYGADITVRDDAGRIQAVSTAFDVLPHWTVFPRYGFLSNFSPQRAGLAATMQALVRFHLNGLQFYDWQYRHDQLLPPAAEYTDPLGRRLSLDVVRGLIDAAHAHGLAALPYLAVYAASAAFWRAHPAWALYDAHGQAIPFGEDFLGYMNPAPNAPWTAHLLEQCRLVLAALPFDGLHVDQYGQPREVYDAAGQPVDLPAAFAGFVSALKARHPQAAVLFNAVSNWPTAALAASPQDFAYIEVWAPDNAYADLLRIVTEARRLSGGRPVVIALYLPADQPHNIRLADALIFGCGGTRIELGENARLLADPYFPKHQALSAELAEVLRRYYDFVVRYGDLLGPAAQGPIEHDVKAPDDVWVTVRAAAGWLAVNLVNMTGLDEPYWDRLLPAPKSLTDVLISVTWDGPAPASAWWASPDGPDLQLHPLGWTTEPHGLRLRLPTLHYWALLVLELNAPASA